MRIELFPVVAQNPQLSQWRWRLRDNAGTELAISAAYFATALLAEESADHLMQHIRGDVDVVRMDPTFTNAPSGPGITWTEAIVASYLPEGDHSDEESRTPEPL